MGGSTDGYSALTNQVSMPVVLTTETAVSRELAISCSHQDSVRVSTEHLKRYVLPQKCSETMIRCE